MTAVAGWDSEGTCPWCGEDDDAHAGLARHWALERGEAAPHSELEEG